LAGRAIDLAPLVSEVVPLGRGVEAMTLASRDGVLKVLLDRRG
jgi:hypothetical protein